MGAELERSGEGHEDEHEADRADDHADDGRGDEHVEQRSHDEQHNPGTKHRHVLTVPGSQLTYVTPIPKPERRGPKPRKPLPRGRARKLAQPDGHRECVGPARGLPGPCWGGLQRHHPRLRSAGGKDTAGDLVWLCLNHHTGRYGVHTLVALAKQLGLYGT